LKDNEIFKRLSERVKDFFVVNEIYKRHGPTPMQKQQEQDTGIDFSYRVVLHKCLKRLLREVVLTKDKQMQLKQLDRTYIWFYRKLETIGAMTAADKDEEELFRNPGKIQEMEARKKARKDERVNKLLDEELNQKKEAGLFSKGERTIHKEIPPAKDRLTDYKRKSMQKLFQ